MPYKGRRDCFVCRREPHLLIGCRRCGEMVCGNCIRDQDYCTSCVAFMTNYQVTVPRGNARSFWKRIMGLSKGSIS